MNAAEALAEARRRYDAQLARNPEIDALAAQLGAHLKWLQENPDAVWRALNQGIINTAKGLILPNWPRARR